MLLSRVDSISLTHFLVHPAPFFALSTLRYPEGSIFNENTEYPELDLLKHDDQFLVENMFKKQIVKISGWFQIVLATYGFIEVIRRFIYTENIPEFSTMIVVSIFALIANGICLYILHKSKSKEELHFKASMIFTSNDIIINMGVITAGFLVSWFNSNKPDLFIGGIVFLLVMQGAIRILKLYK